MVDEPKMERSEQYKNAPKDVSGDPEYPFDGALFCQGAEGFMKIKFNE